MHNEYKKILEYIKLLEEDKPTSFRAVYDFTRASIRGSYAAHTYAAFLAKKGAITTVQHESIRSQLDSDDKEAKYVALVLLKNLPWKKQTVTLNT